VIRIPRRTDLLGRLGRLPWHWLAAAAFVIGCAAVSLWLARLPPEEARPPQADAVRPEAAAPPMPTLPALSGPAAVEPPALPRQPSLVVPAFRLTDAGDLVPMAGAGLAAETAILLSRHAGLFVIAPGSALAEEPDADHAALARRLGVAFIVAGEIAAGAETLRVTARLVEAATGRNRWRRDYQEPPAGLPLLARRLAADLAAALAPGKPFALPAEDKPVPELAAWHAATLGLAAFGHDLPAARLAFNEAVAADTSYAFAWAMLGLVHIDEFLARGDEHSMRRAIGAGAQALSLDGDLPEVYALIAAINLEGRGNIERALAAAERAVAVEPNGPDALAWLAAAERAAGAWAAARRHAEAAIRRHPRHPPWYLETLALAQLFLDDHAAALATASRYFEAATTATGKLRALELRAAIQGEAGDVPAARETLRILNALDPTAAAQAEERAARLFARPADRTRWLAALSGELTR
jgi:TolB-like protein